MRWVKKPIAAQMKRAQTNMTYVVDGNKCANAVPQGQYFQLINSTIAGRSDGVYTASKAIPANEVIDNTYFNQTSPIAEGAINKISSELTTLNSKFTWKLVGQATGTTSVSIQGINASEFMVIVDINGSGNKESIHIVSAEISGTSWYRAGGYTSVSTPALVTIAVNINVTLTNASLGTTDYTNDSVVRVYYR